MAENPRVEIQWEMTSSAPDTWMHPDDLPSSTTEWLLADVPGTAASTLRNHDRWDWDNHLDFDAYDWWWRGQVSSVGRDGRWFLHLGGLATVADVWVNSQHVLTSESMWLSHDLELDDLADPTTIFIRCRALKPLLAKQRKPRARWRTRLTSESNLRWYRTTLLGRMPGWSPRPAPVGPWRPITVTPALPFRVTSRRLRTTVDETTGMLDIDVLIDGEIDAGTQCVVQLGDATTVLRSEREGPNTRLRGSVSVRDVELWWPHTHGDPSLYEATVTVGDERVVRQSVGFRAISIDRANDGFDVIVNGVPIFCRGACWTPTDAVTAASPADLMRETLDHAVSTGMNIVRLTGTMQYESDEFYDACDELGVMVWHDMMFANFDYPATEEFLGSVHVEIDQFIDRMQGRPSLVVLCGSSETEQQAAMMGVSRTGWSHPLFDTMLPSWFREGLPDIPYVSSSPSGGAMPFHPNAGASHYYGVGAYLRDLSDARHANVRFASECLAFANVPDEITIDELLRPGQTMPTHPRWKERVPRDNGATWDFDDVRDHYFRVLYGEDPLAVRSSEPGRYLDQSRSVTGDVMAQTFAEWRRPASSCGGGIILMMRDLWPGAGWGLIDAHGRPKEALRRLRDVLAPATAFITNEGLNGLFVHVINDRLRTATSDVAEVLERPTPNSAVLSLCQPGTFSVDEIIGRFTDSSYAYRFGPRNSGAVSVTCDETTALVHLTWATA